MISTKTFPSVTYIFMSLLASVFNPTSHEATRSDFHIGNYKTGPVFCISSMPDYYQRDTTFGVFPDKGATYCGPVAVSNSLVWFSEHGYPSLMKSSGNSYRDQHELISLLGSPDYMDAGHGGATVESFCRGLKKYLQDCRVNGQIESEGMYDVSDEFRAEKNVPDFERMKLFTLENQAVWLNIGWYKFNPSKNIYTKTGGHWVNLVGYGYDEKGYNVNCLIIHDPDTNDNSDHFLDTEEISSGTLINGPKYKQDATGFRRFKTGYNRFGVIGGVVYLTLESMEKNSPQFTIISFDHLVRNN
jgi:hypothetical protein